MIRKANKIWEMRTVLVQKNNGGLKKELRSLELKPEYNTEDDDIIKDFYGPCLAVSHEYDRAVGYFRANIYRELGEDLLNFVIHGGKVRIVCSPDIPEPDEMAAREGYDLRGKRSYEQQTADILSSLEIMRKNPKEADCLDMLRLLIEKESLELFIATRPGGVFHRKIGVFRDKSGNIVAFSGSGNETQRAISAIEDWANDEVFDVYRSWGMDFESSRAESKDGYLTRLIAGGTNRTKTRRINQIEREFLSRFRRYSNYEECREGARNRSSRPIMEENLEKYAMSPYYYQLQAIDSWNKAGRVGMISMATGTGKTVTALFAIKDLINEGRPILILVPSQILLDQWLKSIRSMFPTVPILCAGGSYDWRANNYKRLFVSKNKSPRIVLATMDTASSNDFMEFFNQAYEPVLVADEAHRLGSEQRRRILQLNFKERLGLSATPERLFDEEGSSALRNFFGETPVYDLAMGSSVKISSETEKEVPVLGRFLSRYTYDFKIAHLTQNEQQEWDVLTKKIRRYWARIKSTEEQESLDLADNQLKLLLIKRASIVKLAEEKIKMARQIISEDYPSESRWIVYCQDENQLNQVAKALKADHPYTNILVYHSKMSDEERQLVLDLFEKEPGIIVSIRCLDEGVDIPSADGALILASSTNPREYVQRRGRVLRKARGKIGARIIDVIVLPESSDEEDVPLSIVKGELARAYEFASLSENKDVLHRLWKICVQYGVRIGEDDKVGLEE